MNQYFILSPSPMLTVSTTKYHNNSNGSNSSTERQVKQSNKTNINVNNCLIAKNLLVYVELNYENQNKGKERDKHKNRASSRLVLIPLYGQVRQWYWIQIDANILDLSNITHIIQLTLPPSTSKPTFLHSQQETQDESHINLALITNIKICAISIKLPQSLQKHKYGKKTEMFSNSLNNCLKYTIYDSYYLLHQPYTHAHLVTNNNNNTNRLVILNQQVLQTSIFNSKRSQSQYLLVLAGFDINFRLIINVYNISNYNSQANQDQQNQERQCKQLSNVEKQGTRSMLNLVTQFQAQKPAQQKCPYQNWFTLCQTFNSNTMKKQTCIVLYKIFNQKKKPMQPYIYNISQALYHQAMDINISNCYYIKPQQINHHIGTLDQGHVKGMYRDADDLYVCYTKYGVGKAKAEACVLVNNLAGGYCRNIINLRGAILHISILNSTGTLKYSQLGTQKPNKSMAIITRQQSPMGYIYLTYIVKMDSSIYNPQFELQTVNIKQRPVFVGYSNNSNLQEGQRSKYFATLDEGGYGCQKQNMGVSGAHDSLSSSLKIYEIIQKKFIYCEIWQRLGSIGGSNFLSTVLEMF